MKPIVIALAVVVAASTSVTAERRALLAVAIAAALAALAVINVAVIGGPLPEPSPDGRWLSPRPASAATAAEVARPPELGPLRRRGWVPRFVRIPRIGVAADVLPMGMGRHGPEIPSLQQVNDIGWFRHGARVGEPGNVVMFGHLDSRDGPAVLARAKELRPGDEITVAGKGRPERYRVTSLASVAKGSFPVEAVYRTHGTPTLRLITCDGLYDRRGGTYSHNLIVTAEPVIP